MKAQHHPSDQQLLGFAQGTLSYHEEVFVSAHTHFCTECANRIREHEAIAAALIAEKHQTQPVAKAEECGLNLDSMLDMLDEQVQAATKQAPQQTGEASLPSFMSHYAPQGLKELSWKRVLPHIAVCELETLADGSKIMLHKISSGGRVPAHTHHGREHTVVLSGGFSDSHGVYTMGDYVLRDGEHQHSPVVMEDQECICLTLTEAPLKMTSWKWRWLNPFLS